LLNLITKKYQEESSEREKEEKDKDPKKKPKKDKKPKAEVEEDDDHSDLLYAILPVLGVLLILVAIFAWKSRTPPPGIKKVDKKEVPRPYVPIEVNIDNSEIEQDDKREKVDHVDLGEDTDREESKDHSN